LKKPEALVKKGLLVGLSGRLENNHNKFDLIKVYIMVRYYRNTVVNVIRIFRFLKQAHEEDRGHLTVSEIARELGMHKWTVSRTLDIWMGPIVDMVIPEELEDVGLKIKLVSLKNPDIKEEQVVRMLSVRN